MDFAGVHKPLVRERLGPPPSTPGHVATALMGQNTEKMTAWFHGIRVWAGELQANPMLSLRCGYSRQKPAPFPKCADLRRSVFILSSIHASGLPNDRIGGEEVRMTEVSDVSGLLRSVAQ